MYARVFLKSWQSVMSSSSELLDSVAIRPILDRAQHTATTDHRDVS